MARFSRPNGCKLGPFRIASKGQDKRLHPLDDFGIVAFLRNLPLKTERT